MVVELFDLCVHVFHTLFSGLDLLLSLFNILLVFLRVLFATSDIELTLGGEEGSENVRAVTDTSAAVLDRWDVADILVNVGRGVLFEWQDGVELLFVGNFLKLLLITLNLLFQIFDSLCYTLGNFQIVLDLFHRSSGFGLFESILGKGLMSVFQLSNFLLLQINFSHLSMVVSDLFIIIIISWLLILLKLIDWLLLLGFLVIWFLASDILIFFTLDDCFGLSLDNLSWILRLHQRVFGWLRRLLTRLLILISNLLDVLDLLLREVKLLKLLNKV